MKLTFDIGVILRLICSNSQCPFASPLTQTLSPENERSLTQNKLFPPLIKIIAYVYVV